MKNVIIVAIYFTAFMLVSACSPESATLYSQKPPEPVPVYTPPPEPVIPPDTVVGRQEFKWISEDGGQSQLDFNPQVDILFVIDNSDSMKSAQDNLFRNVDQFTSNIAKNKMIDYHIGAVSVWDSSERYARDKKDSYQIGDLRFIKNGQSQQSGTRRFVTKVDGSSILAATLKIGVVPYESRRS